MIPPLILPNPQSFTIPYLPKKQTVPILRGEGEDLTVKIKVFFLTANTEVIEDKMGHIHPGETPNCGSITKARELRTPKWEVRAGRMHTRVLREKLH